MRLLPKRPAAVPLEVAPDRPLRPTESVTVTLTLDVPLEKVTTARVELGYVNSFRYQWAGRRDAALRYDDLSLTNTSDVGTSYGSEKDADEWVGVLDEPLDVEGGVLGVGAHQVTLRLPSWSPGSSASCVRWFVRLRVERDGRDVTAERELRVVVPAPDPVPELRLVQGTRALFNTVRWEVTTDRPCYRPGDEVRGTIVMTPVEEVTRDGVVDVCFARMRASHPLTRTSGSETELFTRPHVTVARDVRLVKDQPTTVRFAAVLPEDVDPTTEAVHSSLDWYVQARITFAGLTGGIESARREIVVHTG